MGISPIFEKLLQDLSEENYEKTVSDYRFWMKFGIKHGWVRDDQLYDGIWANMKPELVYPGSSQLIHPTSHLLIRFITDVGLDPALSTYASNTHDRLCHALLGKFVDDSLGLIWDRNPYDYQLYRFYTYVNFLAHWVNLGHLDVEDVQDHILQSLTFQPTIYIHQLNSLMILLKISGATFAAYVDSSVMERCCDLLKPNNPKILSLPVTTRLAEVRGLVLMVKIIYER